ncbi:telomere repeat binding factor-domain-containing protein [Coniochaeta sp. 2T2.1]|nr:telomere repeat binding factor-domain-containing protein [Coniochaeta sp. 2T2.1]
MIQNALGSFDEQVNQPHDEQHNGAGQEPGTEPRQGRPQAPKKVEQKRMKFASNPYYVMRTMSLPLLGSLVSKCSFIQTSFPWLTLSHVQAIQILLALSQQSREETVALMADNELEFRKAYDTLKTALGHARRIFSEGSPLLFADELDISDSEDRETIRMSNLAAISTSAFSGDGSLLADVHDNFPTIFVPEEGDFVKDLKPLYLDFKTQSMLYSLTTAHTPQERSDVLDRFFPPNFDDLLTQRHGDSLFQSNREDLVSEVGTRRQALLESILDDEKRQRLKDEYPINGFLDSLVDYLQSHLTMVIDYAEKYGINIPVSEESVVNEPVENGDAHDDHDELSALLQNATAKLLDGMDMDRSADPSSDSLGLGKLIQESLQNHSAPVKDEGPESNSNDGGLLESGGLASLIASKLTDFDQFANSSNAIGNEVPQHGLPQVTQASMQSAYTAQYNQIQQTQYYGYGQPPPPPQPPADGSNLPPNQTFPTSVLYERARQAAVAKSSSAARREGIHSTRRAWTPEEEKALMAGLDLVKGPHWSQILSLFGANGSISDILKDRTQVQLKDKARNLKLFFLKTNSEMPYYLQCVTGELKTRAPGQAARKEAEEKARQNSEEEQARLQGIMTLAGGLQHNHPQVRSSITAQHTPAYARTTPMTPHANSAQLNRGMHTPITQQTTLAPATPSMQQKAPNTQGFSGASMVTANISSIGTAAPETSSMGTGTPNISTGAQVTPNVGAGGGIAGYNSVSAPPQPSTTATTPASPVVKSEPQEQPVLIQPRPVPQPIRPAEPAGITNGFQQQQQPQQPQQLQQHQQQQQPQVHHPTQQATPAPAAAQPRMQLSFPPAPSTPSHMHSSQPTSPARPQSHAPTPVPERVQSSTPAPHTPYHSLPHTPYQSHHTSPAPTPTPVAANHDPVGDLAQLANYQAPQQHTPQQQHYRQNNQQSYQTNANRSSNEHHENHDQHIIHHDPEPNADMTLLQTLQAALAAAPSG